MKQRVGPRHPGPRAAAAAIALVAAQAALGQEPAPPAAPALPASPPATEQAEPADGVAPAPGQLEWQFNFDASWGAFGFNNSLYTDPKPEEPSGDLGDDWFEGAIKPAATWQYGLKGSAQLYAGLSGVGERTYGAAPSVAGEDASSFNVEDLYVGWRSGDTLSLGKDVLDFTLGRAQYTLGHGMLLWDGSAEGGSRGGYWTNARKAFELAAIARFRPGNHTVEGFYLDKDDLPEADTGTKVSGVNYEYAIGEDTTLGATYMRVAAHRSAAPRRDGLNVYDLRAYTAPFAGMKGLSFEAEYAIEDNGALLDSTAWNLLAAYQFESGWQPRVSYRYAIFEGDDPTTLRYEGFDGLLTGFYDWGAWWQGEIAGEYFVSNSNLISHQLRVHVTPGENIESGLMLYDFTLDHPAALGPQVTSDAVARELDWYTDWTLNDHFVLSFVLAIADPGAAIQQSTGRTDTFVYGMAFVTYKY
jgi:alginate export protein